MVASSSPNTLHATPPRAARRRWSSTPARLVRNLLGLGFVHLRSSWALSAVPLAISKASLALCSESDRVETGVSRALELQQRPSWIETSRAEGGTP
jgi:hypothetical protein